MSVVNQSAGIFINNFMFRSYNAPLPQNPTIAPCPCPDLLPCESVSLRSGCLCALAKNFFCEVTQSQIPRPNRMAGTRDRRPLTPPLPRLRVRLASLSFSVPGSLASMDSYGPGCAVLQGHSVFSLASPFLHKREHDR